MRSEPPAAALSIPETGLTTLLHATCVAIGEQGVLLLGPPGAGKSDLAIRLIDRGAELVADDQLHVVCRGTELFGSAPDRIGGMIESRAVGILRLPYRRTCRLVLAVRLGDPAERLPGPRSYPLLGASLPLIMLDPRLPSAAATVRLALLAEHVA
jgi:serine kinase of HPr protein (carbohydrate metabolism regulator)